MNFLLNFFTVCTILYYYYLKYEKSYIDKLLKLWQSCTDILVILQVPFHVVGCLALMCHVMMIISQSESRLSNTYLIGSPKLCACICNK